MCFQCITVCYCVCNVLQCQHCVYSVLLCLQCVIIVFAVSALCLQYQHCVCSVSIVCYQCQHNMAIILNLCLSLSPFIQCLQCQHVFDKARAIDQPSDSPEPLRSSVSYRGRAISKLMCPFCHSQILQQSVLR